MSELTRCNYCTLREMRHRAAKRGAEVIVGAPDDKGWIPVRYSDSENPCAWFLALSDECAC